MYSILKIKESDRILIVSPHPDDETIGCGGILALYGPQCDVLLLTDGRRGIPEGSTLTELETAKIRMKEFTLVMEYFNIHDYKMLQIPDGNVNAYKNELFSIDLYGYDLIFVPNRNERHPDHKVSYMFLKQMCFKKKIKAELIEYEVWSPIIEPNRFLNVSNVMDVIIEGLLKYKSQFACIDYEALAKGVKMYRGAPHHVDFCEAYYVNTKLSGCIKGKIADILPKRIRKKLINLKMRLYRG